MRSRLSTLGIAAIACIAMSCNDTGNNPDTTAPANNTGGKGPQVLSCVNVFSGITHCGINGATVVDNGGSVKVSDFDPSGTRGVSCTFNPANGWTQDMDFSFPSAGYGELTYTVTADGAVNSSLTIRQVDNKEIAEVIPDFGGEEESTYSIYLYQGETLVGSQEHIGSNDPAPVFNGKQGPGNGGCWYPVQVNTSGQGSATYVLKWFDVCPVVFRLPNGHEFICDNITISSDVGVYQHVEGVDVQGNMETYSITNEQLN